MTSKLALHWLPCQAPGIIGSVVGLVGLVSVYCDRVRWKVWSVTSTSVWQHVKLSEQIRPWDTLTCCWDVKQPTNNNNLRPVSPSWPACFIPEYQITFTRVSLFSPCQPTPLLLLPPYVFVVWCPGVPLPPFVPLHPVYLSPPSFLSLVSHVPRCHCPLHVSPILSLPVATLNVKWHTGVPLPNSSLPTLSNHLYLSTCLFLSWVPGHMHQSTIIFSLSAHSSPLVASLCIVWLVLEYPLPPPPPPSLSLPLPVYFWGWVLYHMHWCTTGLSLSAHSSPLVASLCIVWLVLKYPPPPNPLLSLSLTTSTSLFQGLSVASHALMYPWHLPVSPLLSSGFLSVSCVTCWSTLRHPPSLSFLSVSCVTCWSTLCHPPSLSFLSVSCVTCWSTLCHPPSLSFLSTHNYLSVSVLSVCITCTGIPLPSPC